MWTRQSILRRSSAVSLTGLALALSGCAHEGLRSTAPKQVEGVATNQVQGPFAQAGSQITVHMDQALGTIDSVRQERFTATVDEPLAGSGGEVIVPKGAKLTGHVVGTHAGDKPYVKVAFDTIDTTNGSAPIAAKVLAAGEYAYLGPPVRQPGYGYGWYGPESVLYPYWGAPLATGYGYGTGTGYYWPRELRVPQGAKLILQLTRPLLPPGSAYVGPQPK